MSSSTEQITGEKSLKDDPGEGPSTSGMQRSNSKDSGDKQLKKNSLNDENIDPIERDFRREIEHLKQTAGITVSQHLIQLCRRGDWLGVDTLLRLTPYEDLNCDERAQGK
jgi:hypothetical protein